MYWRREEFRRARLEQVLIDTDEPTRGELDDDAGMPLSEFGYAAQESFARSVRGRLARATTWRLISAFNDLQREVVRREALARSA